MDYELKGYAPDLDPTLPGVVPECAAWIPSNRGMKAAPSPVDLGFDALAAECRGAAILKQLDDTARLLAGTTTNMYEEGSGSWTSRYACGAGETLSAVHKWSFGIFGNIELAISPNVPMIGSDTGAMSTIAKGGVDAPAGRVVVTVGDFVFVFNYTFDGTHYPDGWKCSAIADHTDWTDDVATQADSGRLYSTPGKIIGAKRFGEGVAVYKKNAIYIGIYEGPPKIWRWVEVPGEVGAMCNEVIVDIGTPEDPKHIFMSPAGDWYMFDGAKPVPLFAPCKAEVFGELNNKKEEECNATHDRINDLIYFYYPVGSNDYSDKCVVYSYRQDRWGRDDREIHGAIEYISTGTTYGGVGALYSTYADLPNNTYGNAFLGDSQILPAVFNASDKIVTLTGTAGSSSFTSNEFGDDTMYTMLTRVKPRYLTAPSSAQMLNRYKYNIGDSFTDDTTTSETSERFDVMREARWHQCRFDYTGDVEIPMAKIDLMVSGDE